MLIPVFKLFDSILCSIGVAPLHFGSIDVCIFIHPNFGKLIIFLGIINPYEATIIKSVLNSSIFFLLTYHLNYLFL